MSSVFGKLPACFPYFFIKQTDFSCILLTKEKKLCYYIVRQTKERILPLCGQRHLVMKLLTKEFIYETNTPECHASTLVKKGDRVTAAWFGGSTEGKIDVNIWTAVKENGHWSKPLYTSAREELPHWNPVLFDNGKELLLYYKSGCLGDDYDWQTMLCRSRDGGYTWTAPVLMVEGDCGGRGPVKNKPILLKNGAVIAGASSEDGPWRAFTDLSRDGGYTWERSDYIPLPEGVQVIQPSLWEDDNGVHLLMRSQNQRIYRSDSPDGIHWDMAYPIEVPNNNSGLDLVPLSDRLVLCCNPITSGRTLLALMESADGIHFETTLVLENEPGEFSYPAVIWDGEKICGTYTWKRKTIMYFEALPE